MSCSGPVILKRRETYARFAAMRRYLLSVSILFALAAQAVPQASTPARGTAARRKIPCKTPKIAPSCYWTHGRLQWGNGTPSWRLWKIGTNRILGIHSGANAERFDPLDNEHPEFPAPLDKAYDADYQHKRQVNDPDIEIPDVVFADFEVCPLEPERAGQMQSACIESAKNIVVEYRKPK
jgi:hypothetical protein